MKTKPLLILLSITFSFAFQESFSQNTWMKKANFGGTSRFGGTTGFVIGTKGYIGTGTDSNGVRKDFWEWDQATNTWTQKADFGGAARTYATSFAIGVNGYIGMGFDGGTNFYRDFWEYNQATNTWTQKTSLPLIGNPRSGAIGFAIGTMGYIATGYYYNGTNNYLNDFWEYNPAADTAAGISWTAKAIVPGGGRTDAVGFCIGAKGYIGTGNGGSSSSPYNDFWEYDTSANLWTRKANFGGTARSYATGFAICTTGYIGTGSDSSGAFHKDFWEYNQVNNTWSLKADFGGSGRVRATSFAIGTKGYTGTGQDSSGYTKDFWEYTPDSVCASLPTAKLTASVTSICAEGTNCINFFDHSTGSPTNWKWLFPGANPDTSTQQNPTSICYYTPGTFTVTLIASNTAGSDTLLVSSMITVEGTPPLPIITMSRSDTLICSHASYYQWYFNGNPIVGATDSFYVAGQYGTYAVMITDSFGCSRSSNGIIASVNKLNYLTGIKIYPIFFNSSFIVELPSSISDAEVIIFDMLGHEIMKENMNGDRMEIEKGNLVSGVYFVKVIAGEREFVQKLMVE